MSILLFIGVDAGPRKNRDDLAVCRDERIASSNRWILSAVWPFFQVVDQKTNKTIIEDVSGTINSFDSDS